MLQQPCCKLTSVINYYWYSIIIIVITSLLLVFFFLSYKKISPIWSVHFLPANQEGVGVCFFIATMEPEQVQNKMNWAGFSHLVLVDMSGGWRISRGFFFIRELTDVLAVGAWIAMQTRLIKLRIKKEWNITDQTPQTSANTAHNGGKEVKYCDWVNISVIQSKTSINQISHWRKNTQICPSNVKISNHNRKFVQL